MSNAYLKRSDKQFAMEAAAPDMLAALQKIADNHGGCYCDHSNESCCENPAVGEFCPHCIAEIAIKKASGDTALREKP